MFAHNRQRLVVGFSAGGGLQCGGEKKYNRRRRQFHA
jgi:hypothetical protein